MKFSGEVVEHDPTAIEKAGDILSFIFNSPLFAVIKVLAAIYVAVLIVDIILLLILNNAQEDYRKSKRGTTLPTHSEALRKWKRIKNRLKKGQQNYYKAAILEADQMVEKILIDVGYKQETMGEKIDMLREQAVDSAEILRKAHDVSVRIVQDPDFTLSRKDAEEALLWYEEFMNDMEIFD